MTRLLVVVLLAALLGSAVALEWPYSVVFANLSSAVDGCAKVSGFQFQNGTTPSARQLSKMCGDASCGSLMSHMLHLEASSPNSYNDPTKIDATRLAATNAFSAQVLKFCWYDRLPADPCPSEPFVQFAKDFAEPIATCQRESNLSAPFNISTAELEAFKKRNKTMPVGCYHLMMRVMYLIDGFPCVIVKEQISALLDQTEFVYAFIEAIDPYNFTEIIYTYDEGWSVPEIPDLPTSPPPTPPPTTAATLPDAGGSTDGSVGVSPTQPPISSMIKTARKSSKPTTTAPSQSSSTESSSSSASDAPVTKRPTQSPSTTTPAPQWIKTARDPTITTSTEAPGTTDAPTQNVTVASRSESNTTLITVMTAAAVLLILVVFVIRRRRLQDAKPIDLDDDDLRDDQYSVLTDRSDASAITLCGRELHISKVVPVDALEDVRLIGTGGHAVVFLTVEKKSQRLLASKRLAKNHATDESIEVFLDEIELVSRLRHPCIVEFVGATWTNPLDIQALFEYMERGDLRTYLENPHAGGSSSHGREAVHSGASPWTNEKTLLALDVAEALVYVHSLSPSPVVHRDLKSRNVLLTTRSPRPQRGNEDNGSPTRLRAKLSDFGVSRQLSNNHTMTTGIGTSRWLAPEVMMGGGQYNAACDIYSFGVVLSELDTHRLPYSDVVVPGSDLMIPEITMLSMVCQGDLQPSFSESCPRAVLSLARWCLSFDPNDRPSAEQVATALRSMVRADGL